MKRNFFCFSAVAFLFISSVFSQDAVSLFNEALKKQEAEDYYSAIELYRECLEVNPQYAQVWRNLAYCSYLLGEYELSLSYIDEALRYSSNVSDVKDLKGMILLSLGRTAEAGEIFSDVLKQYPNDIDARFGLAQLDILSGNIGMARNRYLDALKRDGTNRKALLSLALVSAETGNDAAAEKYINLALEYHSGEAAVHYLASYLAAGRGNLSEAEMRARSAVEINPNFDRAYELLADILYARERYDDVCDICDFRIGRDRSLAGAWYLKGKALEKKNELQKAVAAWMTGLSVDPQDEIMRLAMERAVKNTVPLDDPRRKSWAAFHIEKASNFNVNLDSSSERYEYQKALSLEPENLETRRKFASLLEHDNLYELYLYQLKFIKEKLDAKKESNAAKDSALKTDENSPRSKKTPFETELSDTIEAVENLLDDNLSASWNVKPFYLDKSRWSITLYYKKNPVSLVHADSEEIIASSVKEIFDGVAQTSVIMEAKPVTSYSEAFSSARRAKTDYFAVIKTDETERSFSLDAELYSTRTGSKAADIKIYKTGNDRVARTLRRLRSGILDVLPIRGKILQIRGDTVLADLGKSDGISLGAKFDVVRKGSIVTKETGTGIYYPEKTVVGTFTAVRVDEEICEGTFTKKGFYNVLNAQDEIVLVEAESSEESSALNAANETRPRADSEGEPVTEAAQKEELDAMRESLKEQKRESTLINMLRSVF